MTTTVSTGQSRDASLPGNLSASSSSSSLTSSSSFDPHEIPLTSPTLEERRPSALGIRELSKLYKNEQSRKGKARELPAAAAGPISVDDVTRLASPTSPGIGPGSELFASDVDIRGWKIVGGSKWSGNAKVGAYVVYDIEITKRNGGMIEILRRYTDFVRLRNALKDRFPVSLAWLASHIALYLMRQHLRGAIPTLPGKNHMSKFSEKLLDDRRPRLQRFLRTVMLHPEIGKGGVGSVIGEWVLSGTTASANVR